MMDRKAEEQRLMQHNDDTIKMEDTLSTTNPKKNENLITKENKDKNDSQDKEERQQLPLIVSAKSPGQPQRSKGNGEEEEEMSTCSEMEDDNKNDLQRSLKNWFKDATTLIQSPQMARFTQTTLQLLTTATFTAINVSLLPITFPIHVVSSATQGACSLVSEGVNQISLQVVLIHGMAAVVVAAVVERIGGIFREKFFFWWNKEEDEEEENEDEACIDDNELSLLVGSKEWENDDQKSLLDSACVSDVLNGRVMSLSAEEYGGHNELTNSQEPSNEKNNDISRDELSQNSERKEEANNDILLDKKETDQSAFDTEATLTKELSKPVCLMRVCDLNYVDCDEEELHISGKSSATNDNISNGEISNDIKKEMNYRSSPNLKPSTEESTSHNDNKYVELYQIVDPEDSDATIAARRMKKTLDALSREALEMTLQHFEGTINKEVMQGRKKRKLIQWKAENKTGKLLQDIKSQQQMNGWEENEDDLSPAWTNMLEKEVLVWSGKFVSSASGDKNNSTRNGKQKSKNGENDSFCGYDIPLFKGRGIINMSPAYFTELFLDSDRVYEYNRYCVGRTDTAILQSGEHLLDDDFAGRNVFPLHELQQTKIVESDTKIPFTNLSVHLTTLMHAVRLENDGGYMIVSRSVTDEGQQQQPDKEKQKSIGFSGNEILWGVNVVRKVRGHPNKAELISVSQVKSNLLPKFLARKVGIMGVVDFYESLKSLCKE